MLFRPIHYYYIMPFTCCSTMNSCARKHVKWKVAAGLSGQPHNVSPLPGSKNHCKTVLYPQHLARREAQKAKASNCFGKNSALAGTKLWCWGWTSQGGSITELFDNCWSPWSASAKLFITSCSLKMMMSLFKHVCGCFPMQLEPWIMNFGQEVAWPWIS